MAELGNVDENSPEAELQIESIIDDEIVIVETVNENVYSYINNIVNKYGICNLIINLKIILKEYIVTILLYDNTKF